MTGFLVFTTIVKSAVLAASKANLIVKADVVFILYA